MDIRPRSTGEILDDAWRLALADAALLLTLSSLFLAPAAVVLLLLLTHRAPEGTARSLLPALFAVALPLTGIGSGACQALFRRRAEGQPVTLGGCLGEALRRGLDHSAARGMVLLAGLFGTVLLVLPGLGVWLATATVHAVLATGQARWLPALGVAGQESQRQPGKAAAIVLSRLVLLLLAALNLHAFLEVFLWIGDHLAGLDLALVAFVLTPSNPVYDVSLLLLAGLLLAPYAEACNYLLHVDARARYEGLDLWYRVRRLFPAVEKSAVKLVLVLGVLFFAAFPAAADQRAEVLRDARKELAAIRGEVKAADPYPGGQRWSDRLVDVAERLDRQGSRQPGRFPWFSQALPAFSKANRAGALDILAELDRRLAQIEESLAAPQPKSGAGPSKEKLKALLPSEPDDEPKAAKQAEPTPPEPPEPEEPVRREEPARDARRQQPREGPALVEPQRGEGFSPSTWLVLGVVAVSVIVFALLLRRRESRAAQPPKPTTPRAAEEVSLETLLAQPTRSLDNLWFQADDLARSGRCLEGVRTLYLTVLALLHRANLIRCGPMRTNGEYVRQLRAREDICQPFRGLTGLFEVKWYGERSCPSADYDACRRLAESIREGVKAGA